MAPTNFQNHRRALRRRQQEFVSSLQKKVGVPLLRFFRPCSSLPTQSPRGAPNSFLEGRAIRAAGWGWASSNTHPSQPPDTFLYHPPWRGPSARRLAGERLCPSPYHELPVAWKPSLSGICTSIRTRSKGPFAILSCLPHTNTTTPACISARRCPIEKRGRAPLILRISHLAAIVGSCALISFADCSDSNRVSLVRTAC